MVGAAWPREREQQLRRWWEEGLSAAIIAQKFADDGFIVSRSAICGKVGRLGLVGPQTRVPLENLWRGRPRPKKPKPATVKTKVALEPAPVMFREPIVFELAGGPVGCKWIEGHVGTPGWFYCNADVKRGSYCAAHAFMCYRTDPRLEPVRGQSPL